MTSTHAISFLDDNGRTKRVEFVSSLSDAEILSEIDRNARVTIPETGTRLVHVVPADRIVSLERLR